MAYKITFTKRFEKHFKDLNANEKNEIFACGKCEIMTCGHCEIFRLSGK